MAIETENTKKQQPKKRTCCKTQALIDKIHPKLMPKSCKSTLYFLVRHGNWEEGTGIRCAISYIAKRTGWSERQVKRDKKYLKESMVLIKTGNHSKKLNLAEECRINFLVLESFVEQSKILYQEEKNKKIQSIMELEVIHRNSGQVCGNACGKPVDNYRIGDRMAPEIGDRMAPNTCIINHCINTVGGEVKNKAPRNPPMEVAIEHPSEGELVSLQQETGSYGHEMEILYNGIASLFDGKEIPEPYISPNLKGWLSKRKEAFPSTGMQMAA